MCIEHVLYGLWPKSLCLFFRWGNRGQRASGVAASHSREGALLGPEPRVPLRCGQEAQGLVGQAELVWETVLTAKTSLQTLRASDHLGSGTS